MSEWLGCGVQFCGYCERDVVSGLLLVICACLTPSLSILGKTSHMSSAQGSFFHHQR